MLAVGCLSHPTNALASLLRSPIGSDSRLTRRWHYSTGYNEAADEVRLMEEADRYIGERANRQSHDEKCGPERPV